VTLEQLALTVAVLGGLGLVAGRFGLSAIPAYLLAGLLLGPNEPRELSFIEPSEVTTFVAELGIIFLLFFLGLEFTLERLLRSGRHLGLGGSVARRTSTSSGCGSHAVRTARTTTSDRVEVS
jgi:K+:H+ antiporter subunit KhtU